MGQSGERGDLKPIGEVLVGLNFSVTDPRQMAAKMDQIREQYERDRDAFEAFRLTAFLCMSAIERCVQLEQEVAACKS